MAKWSSDLRKWMYQEKLEINDDKTEFLVVGFKQQVLKMNPFTVPDGTTDT